MDKKTLHSYIGEVRAVYSGHAADPEIAGNAASGGVVTALCEHLLRSGTIDGALVYRLCTGAEKPFAAPVIATTPEELRAAQGSIYFSFPPIGRETMELIHSFPGRLAVVGLPCTLKALRKMTEQSETLKQKLVLFLGLFCGHTSRQELLDQVLAMKQTDWKQVVSFRFRKGLWRGNAEACMKDGSVRTWPTSFYNLYQNLFILSHAPCMNCTDHFAETADISCGDIWRLKHRRDTVKRSIFAVRTPEAENAVNSALQQKELICSRETERDLFLANSRSAIFHKAIRARAAAGRLFGLRIAVPSGAPRARWNEFAAACIALGCYRLSISRNGKLLFRVPRFLLKGMLYLMKLLTSF